MITRGPLVSVVITNRDGLRHLEQCLSALATTAYQDLELIVVDNGSTDGSAEFVESFKLPFPARVIRNDTNRSFAEANNQALAIASGEFLCFLNNDVDPITDDWLGYMVESLQAHQAVAIGARLIYPRHRGGARGGAKLSDLSLQHAGVDFDRGHGVPVARALGAGDEAITPFAARIEDVPALTAACLLVRRDAFEHVGGFLPAYNYGFEDVDLCLRLREAGGRIVYDGRAALWHHESATRASDRAVFSARSAANRDMFNAIWGPRLYRAALLDALQGGQRFSRDPFHIAIAASAGEPAASLTGSPRRLVESAFGDYGWRVTDLPGGGPARGSLDPSVEAVLVLDDTLDIRDLPRNMVTMAGIGSDAERWVGRKWFDEFDLVFAASDEIALEVRDQTSKTARLLPEILGVSDATAAAGLAAGVREALIAWTTATRYGLRIGVPSWDVEHWGDYHFARGLQRYLERSGHPTRLHFLPDWSSSTAARDDVAVHLFGLREAPTHPGQVNILWQISHPDLASPALYERYDHVFVASDIFATRMAERVSVPVTPLHQATDPERFRPTSGGPHHELLFVANSRRVHRRIVDDLAGTVHDLAIYGRHWTPDLVDPVFVKDEIVPNAALPRYYAAADIVLNDHWDDMRIEGFLSNRLYDALACRALVLSDHVDGIEAEFDGAVVTYASRPELGRLIERYLADPEERRRLGEHGRAIVLERHTFEHRVAALRGIANPLVAARPATIEADPEPPVVAEPPLSLSGRSGTVAVAV